MQHMARHIPRHRADDAASVTSPRPSIAPAGDHLPINYTGSPAQLENVSSDPAFGLSVYATTRFSEGGYSGELLYPRQTVAFSVN
jgi:hypothetical protein